MFHFAEMLNDIYLGFPGHVLSLYIDCMSAQNGIYQYFLLVNVRKNRHPLRPNRKTIPNRNIDKQIFEIIVSLKLKC